MVYSMIMFKIIENGSYQWQSTLNNFTKHEKEKEILGMVFNTNVKKYLSLGSSKIVMSVIDQVLIVQMKIQYTSILSAARVTTLKCLINEPSSKFAI